MTTTRISLDYVPSLLVCRMLPSSLARALDKLGLTDCTLVADLLDLRDPQVAQKFERATGDCLLAFYLKPAVQDESDEEASALPPSHTVYVNVAGVELYLWLQTNGLPADSFSEYLLVTEESYLESYFQILADHLAPFVAEGMEPKVQNMKYELNMLATRRTSSEATASEPTPTPTPAPAPASAAALSWWQQLLRRWYRLRDQLTH